MLVVIDRGVRRFASGANPYTIYKVPWDVPLPYGPYLWGPFALPIALHADPRMLTLLASLIVPGTCVWAALDCVRRGSLVAAGLFLALSTSMRLHRRRCILPHRHTQVTGRCADLRRAASRGRWTAAPWRGQPRGRPTTMDVGRSS